MKKFRIITGIVLLTTALMITAYSKSIKKITNVSGKEITYTSGDKTFKGYVAYDDTKKGKRPGILIVHEWWGSNEYVRMRARMLAELGYIALAVDMYGDGRLASNPQQAGELSGEVYKDMQALKSRLESAEEKLKTYSETDAGNIAAIGYCFGGSVVLNAAKLGMDFKGVVSFHGNLAGVAPDKNLLKAEVLICHGADDKFVSSQEVTKFKNEMDSIDAKYSFKEYPQATHAFTNPAATALGKKFKLPIAYNKPADTRSWNDMKVFFNTIFNK